MTVYINVISCGGSDNAKDNCNLQGHPMIARHVGEAPGLLTELERSVKVFLNVTLGVFDACGSQDGDSHSIPSSQQD